MKGFIALLLITSAQLHARTPSCGRLEEILGDYEVRLQRQTTTNCNNEDLPEIPISDGAKKADILGKIKCNSLGALEERAKSLGNQITLLGGFQILKDEIRSNKEAAAQENLTKAQRAARDFQKALKTARSLEMILKTPGPESILKQLKSLPENRRNNGSKLIAEIRALCSGRQGREVGSQDACHDNFTLDDNAATEINVLLSQGELSDEQLATWSRALAIKKKDGSDWSFSEMYSELSRSLPKIQQGRLTLNREELNSIKSLPDFQDSASLPFLNALTSASKGMGIHTALEKFKFTALDLKGRLEYETNSKVSWLWSEVKDTGIQLTEEQRALCSSSSRNFLDAKACWNAILAKKSTIPDNKSDKLNLVNNLQSGLSSSFDYHEKFGRISQCIDPSGDTTQLTRSNTGDELSNCSELNMMNADLSNLQEELLLVNGLRDRIASQNQRDMKLRNYALGKYAEMNCATARTTDINCDMPEMVIASQAVSLSLDVLGLSIVAPSGVELPNIEAECDDDKGGMEKDLCSFIAPPPEIANVTDRPAPSSESPYLSVPNARDPSRQAFLDGLTGIGLGIAGSLFNRPQTYVNPYAYGNPFPYNYNSYQYQASLGPADRVLFNQRFYGGYGFYSPTLGVAPYTGFPVTSPYVQAGLTSSSYFSSFGVYK